MMIGPPPDPQIEDAKMSEDVTCDRCASKVTTFDAWWSKEDLRSWDDSKVYTSEPWWSKEKSDDVASGGWQHWNTSDSYEKRSHHEEWRTTHEESTKADDSQRAQSSNDLWIPKDESTHSWIPNDECTTTTATQTIGPDEGGAATTIKDRDAANHRSVLVHVKEL